MGGSAKQLKPHNNLPGVNGNSLNPLQNSPGPGIPAPMKMPGMPGGSFNPMDQLRQLPGMGGGGGGDQGGGDQMDPAQQQQYMNMRAAQENGTETPQMEAQRLMAGMPNIARQGAQAMQKGAGAAGAPVSSLMGGMGSAAGGAPGDIAAMMQRMGGQTAQARPALDPNAQIAQGLGGAQSLAGTAAANEYAPRAGGGRKAAQQAMNPAQAQRMAAKLAARG